MMRQRLLVTLALIVATVSCRPWQREMRSTEGRAAARKLASEWIRCGQRDDAECAVALMHFPAADVGDVLEREKASMVAGFRALQKNFGHVTLHGEQTKPFAMWEVAWTTGTLQYWSGHPDSVKVTYSATFEHAGPGFFQAEACHVGSAWQLRAVHYGLPMSAPGSAAKIRAAGADLLRLVQPPN
jgi:hypothetical protein